MLYNNPFVRSCDTCEKAGQTVWWLLERHCSWRSVPWNDSSHAKGYCNLSEFCHFMSKMQHYLTQEEVWLWLCLIFLYWGGLAITISIMHWIKREKMPTIVAWSILLHLEWYIPLWKKKMPRNLKTNYMNQCIIFLLRLVFSPAIVFLLWYKSLNQLSGYSFILLPKFPLVFMRSNYS